MGSGKTAGKEKVSKSLVFHRVSSDNAAIINSRDKCETGRNGSLISSPTLPKMPQSAYCAQCHGEWSTHVHKTKNKDCCNSFE